MKSADIRQAFINYFSSKDHHPVASSSLVPANDPTLLFTNAGMVQFKDLFLGRESRAYVRAVSSQRVVRAGGKHNDLENVGYTARHHTFFEMLGNFSFGDYFKREAIAYAWEFLTSVLKLPPENLWVTVYEQDTESEQIWFDEIGIDQARFSRLGEKDNFWSMGDVGPCGPCSEIFYDHGPSVPGGPPGSEGEDEDRFVEIWNLVFMQYDRQPNGDLLSLPKPSVDTGMGLERISAVMQGVHNNYDIDIFRALIEAIAHRLKVSDLSNQSLRVIADHIRSASFLICDGVTPSNEGRGYVLRRIIRRALRHANKLGANGTFFAACVEPLIAQMGDAYPELAKSQGVIERLLSHEEVQFRLTLDQGLKLLEQDMCTLKGNQITGETLFNLYDTYGFPVDLTADIARERGLTLDMVGFERAMSAQKARSKQGAHFSNQHHKDLPIEATTEFLGYDQHSLQANIQALFQREQNQSLRPVQTLPAGAQGMVVLDKTVSYPESGGQISDLGVIQGEGALFDIQASSKEQAAILHMGVVEKGQLAVGQAVVVRVDSVRRRATARNHSATHLLHAALRQVLGSHVTQRGSLVGPDRLRFDFAHLKPLTQSEVSAVERLVNKNILANTGVQTQLMSMDAAKSQGALALFDERYGSEVRVLTMGVDAFSKELCGGTHVQRTGEIGVLKMISQSSIASGVRRIEAVTGEAALAYIDQLQHLELAFADRLKVPPESVLRKLDALLEHQKKLEKEVDQLNAKLVSCSADNLLDQVKEVAGVKVLFVELGAVDAKSLRASVDQFKNKLGSGIVLAVSVNREVGKSQLAAGVTQDLVGRVGAGDLVGYAASLLGGKGGGRPDFAMAGGKSVHNISQALTGALSWLESKLIDASSD